MPPISITGCACSEYRFFGLPLPALGARYNGGQELSFDGVNAAPRDRDGYYLSPITGQRLIIDDGFVEGDTVGVKKVYNALTATVVGDPFTPGRRTGFTFTSDSTYVNFGALTGTAYGFFADTARASGTFDCIWGIKETGDGARLLQNANGTPASQRILVEDAAANLDITTVAMTGTSNGTPIYLGSSYQFTTGDSQMVAWNSSGGSLVEIGETATPGGVNFNFSGRDLWFGRHPDTTAYWWDEPITVALFWDEAVTPPDLATLRAVAASRFAGDGADELDSAYSPTVATDGAVTGAYDPVAPTALPVAIGSGAAVTVEQPATSLFALHPIVARYVLGGAEFQESGSNMPTTGTGWYYRASGALLVPESDVTIGTTFPEYRCRGKNAGLIVGKPATGRGVGLNAITLTDYGVISSPADANTFLFKLRFNTSSVGEAPVFNVDPDPEWRWGLVTDGANQILLRLFEGGTVRATIAINQAAFFGSGNVGYIGGHAFIDGSGNITIKAWGWDDAGVPLGTPSATTTYAAGASTGDLAGTWYVGRGRAGGACTNTDILEGYGWAGQALGDAAMQAAVDASVAGDPVESSDADVAFDGITAGFYDPNDLTFLPDLVDGDTKAPVYAEAIGSPAPVTLPAVERLLLADDYIASVANMPTLPTEGTLVAALEVTNVGAGRAFADLGQSGTGGILAAIVDTTSPDRFRGIRGGRTLDLGLSGMTPDPNNITTAGLIFCVIRWTSTAIIVGAVQGGTVIGSVSAAYLGPIDGTTTILKIAEWFAGKLSFAVLDENIDPAVIAPQLVSFYSPRNVGLSRGTLWYAPGYAVADGANITDPEEIVALGSNADFIPDPTIVAGSARLIGRSS